MPESFTVHEEQPRASSSTTPLIPLQRTEDDVESSDDEAEDFLEVNLSQAYLNDERVAALLERRKFDAENGDGEEEVFPRYSNVLRLTLAHNELLRFPERICDLRNLVELNLSNNNLVSLSDRIGELTRLRVLLARNNLLEELPKSAQELRDLRTLNISGNRFDHVPIAVFEMRALVELQLGGNRIETLPSQIGRLTHLEILYLGGNRLTDVPATLGHLTRLTSLVLADNQIETLPQTFAELQALQSLTLHNNQLRALPTGIARLPNLEHLSLRNNPLVTNFVETVQLTPPTLKELAARVLKVRAGAAIEELYADVLPRNLYTYLASANQCVNPRCRGVYFESCAELVKFVDFCGKYRVPLMQYLCSPHCTQSAPTCAYSDYTSSDEDDDLSDGDSAELRRQRRPLMGPRAILSQNPSTSGGSTADDAKMRKILIG